MATTFIKKREDFATGKIAYEVVDTNCNTTSSNDLTGAIESLGCILYEVDNTGNASTAAHLKVYDSTDPADDGSANPEIVLRVQAGVKRQFIGMNLAGAPATPDITHLSLRCVTEAGVAGTTSPGSAVTARILIKDMS